MKVLVGDGARSGGEPLLCRVAWLISSRLVEVGESVAEAVAEVRGAAVLLLEDWVFDNGGPNGAVFIISGLESTVLLLSERATLLAARLLEDGGSIRQGGADFGRKVGLCVWVVLLIRIREVSAEAGRLV
jgi:hypothetical protein